MSADRARHARAPVGAHVDEILGCENSTATCDGFDDRRADTPAQKIARVVCVRIDRIRKTGQTHDGTRRDRFTARIEDGAVGIPLRDEIARLTRQVVAHLGPREAAAGQRRGRRGERRQSEHAARGESGVAGRCTGRPDARRPGVGPVTTFDDRGQACGSPADGDQCLGVGSFGAGDRHEVSSETALRRQHDTFDESHRDHRVVGVAARGQDPGTHPGRLGGGGHRHTAGSPTGALLGHDGEFAGQGHDVNLTT